MIVDLQMPKMTGLELQHHLASTGASIPTIVITAHDEPGTTAVHRRQGRSLSAEADSKSHAPDGDQYRDRNAGLIAICEPRG